MAGRLLVPLVVAGFLKEEVSIYSESSRAWGVGLPGLGALVLVRRMVERSKTSFMCSFTWAEC